MSTTTNFSPEIDDNTLYHKGDFEASTAQLIEAKAETKDEAVKIIRDLLEKLK